MTHPDINSDSASLSVCPEVHPHTHGHSLAGGSHFHFQTAADRLAISLGLTLIILITELVGGWISHSLALLSDAVHMMTDVGALALAWWAQIQAARPPTERRTYGFHRAGIMAAMANALVLLLLSVFIGWEAVKRLQVPALHISAPIMMIVATVALVVNLAIVRFLGHDHGRNLNMKSALLHIVGDAAASAGVIIAGILIAFSPRFSFVDPVLSLLIALIILWGAWRIFAETFDVLMESTPSDISPASLNESLRSVPGVLNIHHLHVWSISPEMRALSGHVLVEDQSLSEAEVILTSIQSILRTEYGIGHATIQLEHQECGVVCALCGTDSPHNVYQVGEVKR